MLQIFIINSQKKTQSILLEIFDGIRVGDLENPFNQYLTDTIIYPLAFNLQYLDEDIKNLNLKYIKKVMAYYFNNTDKEEVMTQAYQNLRSELTSHLYEQGFIDEGILYSNLFDNYEEKLNKIDDLRIFKDETLLNESKILSNAHYIIKKCKNFDCNKQYNDLLNSINAYKKDPIFLALFLEKNTDTSISNLIKQEFSLIDQKNKYLDQDMSYSATNDNNNLAIENVLINSFIDFSDITGNNLNKIQKFIYSDLSIRNIQNKLDKDHLIISTTSIPLRQNVFSVILYISSNDLSLRILSNSFDDDLASNFDVLNNLTSDVNNLPEISSIKKISRKISNQILKDIPINIDDKKTIFFTSNLHDVFNPNLLIFKDNWLVSNFNIGYFLDWSNFKGRNEKKLLNNYHGFGNVDYSSHDKSYVSLEETLIEVEESSRFFTNSKNYLGQKVTENNILLGNKQNSVIHFATHNTSIKKYGLTNVPALVISKTNEDDGYLDAFEIQKIDLSNSDVILSACSTLYSKSNTSDFSKLIRAFKISGSRSIMATRWDVESESAVLISTSYAENLSNGLYPYESISKIQRSYIKDSEYNHPAFWAAYVSIMN